MRAVISSENSAHRVGPDLNGYPAVEIRRQKHARRPRRDIDDPPDEPVRIYDGIALFHVSLPPGVDRHATHEHAARIRDYPARDEIELLLGHDLGQRFK